MRPRGQHEFPARERWRPGLADVLLFAIPAVAVVLAGAGKLMGWA